jgi:hypothetical protein
MYEGFGLPILEAMHCGAPVIAGNNSSQIEVVGDAGLLFNVADAGELAGHMARLLGEPAWARELGERAAARARRFSWEATADKALQVLTGSHAPAPTARPLPAPRRPARRRIAFFSPLPPLASPVADHAARLLEELSRRYTVDLYHDAGSLPYIGLRSPEPGCYDYRLFERNSRALGYHALVYQMGDSHHHHYMYDTLLRHPGVVALHDLGLAGFQFSYARRAGVDGDGHIRRELEAACGASCAEAWRAIAARAEAPGGMAAACIERGIDLAARILERAAAVVVPSPRCLERVRMRFPAHLGKISVVAIRATAAEQNWSAAADAYEEVIEWAATRRASVAVTVPGWLQVTA